jgi:hypothetical protein
LAGQSLQLIENQQSENTAAHRSIFSLERRNLEPTDAFSLGGNFYIGQLKHVNMHVLI